jgi:hypothetical protein
VITCASYCAFLEQIRAFMLAFIRYPSIHPEEDASFKAENQRVGVAVVLIWRG